MKVQQCWEISHPAIHTTPEDQAFESLRNHGKTFHYAGRILGREKLKDSARLYSFCRFLDDIADEENDAELAKELLASVEQSLHSGHSVIPQVRDFLQLAEKYEIECTIAQQLIKGLQSDIGSVRIDSHRKLIRYSYRVAGTVGLMMCRVLEVDNSKAFPHAIDLGIGMQLTNIARDIWEDANRERIYLPKLSIPMVIGALNPAAENISDRKKIQSAINEVLLIADKYYASGESGLSYLPFRSRLAILSAARCYRAIGLKLARMNYLSLSKRAVVSNGEKLLRTLNAAVEFTVSPKFWKHPNQHCSILHQDLSDLPFANPPKRGIEG